MRQARVGHPQRPCKGCTRTQARVGGYPSYPPMLESPLTARDRPSRTPPPYVEDVSGSRNLGQSWDGNGCQSHQDDEQRIHGTSSSPFDMTRREFITPLGGCIAADE
jgi:hypothetical protein